MCKGPPLPFNDVAKDLTSLFWSRLLRVCATSSSFTAYFTNCGSGLCHLRRHLQFNHQYYRILRCSFRCTSSRYVNDCCNLLLLHCLLTSLFLLGKLRFQAPQPPLNERSLGVQKADTISVGCVQAGSGNMITTPFRSGNGNNLPQKRQSSNPEDCLFLKSVSFCFSLVIKRHTSLVCGCPGR